MQCPNCHFHNMPGSGDCGRCGTSLRLATAVLDIHPPRASQMQKRFRRAVPVRRAIVEVRDAFETSGARAGTQRLYHLAPWSLLLRCALPGWAHFHAKQRVRGHLFLWGTVTFLLPGLLLLGTVAGSMLLGMAFSVHSWAALDIVTQSFPEADNRQRMGRSIYVSILLLAFVYFPVGFAIQGLAGPTVVSYATNPFHVGDVILVNRWVPAQPGQVAMYQIPNYVQTIGGGPRNVRNVHFTGERFDRILAGPGDRVLWEHGKLTVNGKPSSARPLNPAAAPRRLATTVPEDHYLILATTTPYVARDDPEEMWLALSLVPSENLIGHAIARTNPLSRFSLLRS